MKNVVRKLLCGVLVMTMLLNILQSSIITHAQKDSDSGEKEQVTMQEQIQVEGMNSFGDLLSKEITEEQEKIQENSGYNVFSIEMQDKQASVTFETVRDAILIVAVYNDSGETMLASGSVNVAAGDKEATVSIDIESMPQYFTVCGYLVDSETMRPLSKVFESQKYTQEISEFLEKTTEDFEGDRVLNLDEDITNNFAIYAEDVIVLTETVENQGQNIVAEVDEENKTYVIENVTDEVSQLQSGDIFSYEYGENEVLIIKVASIEITGTTAILTGQETTTEEVFDYVKISGVAQPDLENIDPSTCSEGVTFTGYGEMTVEPEVQPTVGLEEPKVQLTAGTVAESTVGVTTSSEKEPMITPEVNVDEGKIISPDKLEGEKTYTKAFNHTLDKEFKANGNSIKITGVAELTLDTTFEYILTLSKQYVSLKFDYYGGLTLDINGKASYEVSLTMVPYVVAGVVEIRITPSLRFDATADLHTGVSLSGTIGFSCDAENGIQNLTTTPEFKAFLEMDATLYVGVSLHPEIIIISDQLARLGMTGTIGGEIQGHLKKSNVADETIKHDCSWCIDGDIYGVYSLSCEAKFMDSDKAHFQISLLDEKIKWKDFYYCVDKDEFAFTVCPYQQYLVTVTVQDRTGNPISGAVVNDSETTGSDGKVSLWLSSGETTITAEVDDNIMAKTVEITEPQSVILGMGGNSSSSSESGNGTGAGTGSGSGDFDSNHAGNVQQIAVGGTHTLALMKDGNIYAWGDNGYGQFGDGTVASSKIPVKITNNDSDSMLHENTVKAVYAGGQYSATLMKDGSLYTWGYNYYGQLGDGTTTTRKYPVKVLDHVVSVSLGTYHSAAITEDGSLYMWGYNSCGQLGDGTAINRKYPVKVLEDVVSVSLGIFHSAAITEDGSLYTWGSNIYGQLGNGKFAADPIHTTSLYTAYPIKVFNFVGSISVSRYNSAAITEDGSLYTWGRNDKGQLCGGITSDKKATPQLITGNIKKVKCAGSTAMVLTKDGNLYVWGSNKVGQLGIGIVDTDSHSEPIKILENVVDIDGEDFFSSDENNTLFAITKDGRVYAWGDNYSGQLGDGTTEDRYTPTIINIPAEPILLTTMQAGIAAGTIVPAVNTTTEEIQLNTTGISSDTTVTTGDSTIENSTESTDTGDGATTESPEEVTEVVTEKKATFTDLQPNQTYNFYSMKNAEEENLFSSENLLYIKQVQADENGKLTVGYNPAFSCAVPAEFVVQMDDIKMNTLDIRLPQLTYNGKEQYVQPTITGKNMILAEGRDYELSGDYVEKNSGTYKLHITGKGNYSGTITVPYTIQQVDCKDVTIEELSSVIYSGESFQPALTVKHGETILQEGIDYEVEYRNHKSVGDGIAIVKGLGNYKGKQMTLFAIEPCQLSQEMVTEIPTQSYTGKTLTPELEILHNGEKLLKNRDYNVTYENNVEVGTAEVTITGVGNYAGILTKNFIIEKVTSPEDNTGDSGSSDSGSDDNQGEDNTGDSGSNDSEGEDNTGDSGSSDSGSDDNQGEDNTGDSGSNDNQGEDNTGDSGSDDKEEGNTEDSGSNKEEEKPGVNIGGNQEEKPSGNTGNNSEEKPSGNTGNNSEEKPSGNTGNNSEEKPSGNTGNNSEEKPSGNIEENSGENTGNNVIHNVEISVGSQWTDEKSKAVYTITSIKKGKYTVSYKKPKSSKEKNIIIPDVITINNNKYKVTSVAENAFSGNKNIKKIIVGSNVKSIGKNAFSNCKKLNTLEIGKNVTSIGENALKGCKKLKTLIVKTKKLTKKGIKNALKNSSIKTIKLSGAAAGKKIGKYKKYFAKANSGKKVAIVYKK